MYKGSDGIGLWTISREVSMTGVSSAPNHGLARQPIQNGTGLTTWEMINELGINPTPEFAELSWLE